MGSLFECNPPLSGSGKKPETSPEVAPNGQEAPEVRLQHVHDPQASARCGQLLQSAALCWIQETAQQLKPEATEASQAEPKKKTRRKAAAPKQAN